MNATDSPNTLFYYEIENLFRKCVERTRKIARKVSGAGGYPDLDDMCITENDRGEFGVALRLASGIVFRTISQLSQGIEDANLYNAGIGSTQDGYIVYTCLLPTNWDPNLTSVLDSHIDNALVSAVVVDWFKSLYPELANPEENRYKELSIEIQGTLKLRTIVVRRKYRLY